MFYLCIYKLTESHTVQASHIETIIENKVQKDISATRAKTILGFLVFARQKFKIDFMKKKYFEETNRLDSKCLRGNAEQ